MCVSHYFVHSVCSRVYKVLALLPSYLLLLPGYNVELAQLPQDGNISTLTTIPPDPDSDAVTTFKLWNCPATALNWTDAKDEWNLSALIRLKADQGGVHKGQLPLERGVIAFVPDMSTSVLQPFFVCCWTLSCSRWACLSSGVSTAVLLDSRRDFFSSGLNSPHLLWLESTLLWLHSTLL